MSNPIGIAAKIWLGSRSPAEIVRLQFWGSEPACVASGERSKTVTGIPDPLKIDTEQDLLNKLGIEAVPGAKQYLLLLFDAIWVAKTPHLSRTWPLEKVKAVVAAGEATRARLLQLERN